MVLFSFFNYRDAVNNCLGLLFFRYPERISINDNSYLVSPADGLVTNISETNGPEELGLENKKFTKISIFMNVFNCHVNRSPIEGKIEEIFYKPGKILKRFS